MLYSSHPSLLFSSLTLILPYQSLSTKVWVTWLEVKGRCPLLWVPDPLMETAGTTARATTTSSPATGRNCSQVGRAIGR